MTSKLLLTHEGMYNEMLIVVISGEWNHNRFSFPSFVSATFAIFIIHALFWKQETKL